MRPINADDSDGWNAFREGDDEALMRLYRQHLTALYAYGYNLARDRSLVEDAIQDVFLYLHQHRNRVDSAQNIRAYLMQSVRHRILALLKKSPAMQTLSNADSFLVDDRQEPAWVQDEADAERSRRLKNLLNQLPKRQREALYLIYFEQLSYEEAAQIMQVDVKSVYNFVYKALTAIRQTSGVGDWLLALVGLGLLSHFLKIV